MSDGWGERLRELREGVRARLPMADLCAKEGIEGAKIGGLLKARCPFHEDRRPSFVIGGRAPDRAHCFGCGWDGDVFAFWAQHRGIENDHKRVVNELAVLVGLPPLEPLQAEVKWKKPKARGLSRMTAKWRVENNEKPALPVMRALRAGEVEQLAKLRGLSVAGVRVAASVFRRIGFCEWPQFQDRFGAWRPACQVHWHRCAFQTAECIEVPRWPCWVVTDESRWVAQFRRMDGGEFPCRNKKTGEDEPFKSWTKGTGTWPIGCEELEGKLGVLLVEGGADMLACYHFLHRFERLRDVAVCCMLGSGRINEAVLDRFKGRRVRIIADCDDAKPVKKDDPPEKWRRAGLENAYKWQEQLTEAGAVVETFFLDGLVRADGKPVKDCNDLALCLPSVIESDEIREAFTEWKEGFGG